MKYILTNNTITYDGHTLHQVQEATSSKLGGYVESLDLIGDDECSICINSYLYGNSRISGGVVLLPGAVVKNSTLHGIIFIMQSPHIINSHITTSHIVTYINCPNLTIINRTAELAGHYKVDIFNDGRFVQSHYLGMRLIQTDNYVQIGCLVLTVDKAWKILHSQKLLDELHQKYFKEANIYFTPIAQAWLLKKCKESVNYQFQLFKQKI